MDLLSGTIYFIYIFLLTVEFCKIHLIPLVLQYTLLRKTETSLRVLSFKLFIPRRY